MEKAGLLVLALLAACAGRTGLSLIEREMLVFKAENEELRTEDLLDRYERQKEKADEVSVALLAVSRKRDDLYSRYDAVRGEVAQADRDVKVATAGKAKLAAALKKAQADSKQLAAQLAAQRKAIAALEKELAAARKKREALEAKKAGGKSPG